MRFTRYRMINTSVMSKSEQLEVRICLLCCFFVTECNAGYYGSGNDTCTLCPGNTIKSVQGDASGCNAETPCDCVSNEVNAEHTACGEYPIVFFFSYKFHERICCRFHNKY